MRLYLKVLFGLLRRALRSRQDLLMDVQIQDSTTQNRRSPSWIRGRLRAAARPRPRAPDPRAPSRPASARADDVTALLERVAQCHPECFGPWLAGLERNGDGAREQ